MEKKRTAEETLIHTLINRQDEIKQGKDQPFIDMLHEYATQETKPLQERIDELEGALKGLIYVSDKWDRIWFNKEELTAINTAKQALKPQQ